MNEYREKMVLYRYMNNYVLDTNIFFNMEEGLNLGQKTEEVMIRLTKSAQVLHTKGLGVFYMPPRVVDEMQSFFEDKKDDVLVKFLSVITVQSPRIDTISYSARIFYDLVEDVYMRNLKGLRIGEEEIENGATAVMGAGSLDKKEFQTTVGNAIRGFRERYRRATRFGFLDSVADLDIISLAVEQNAAIISTDAGVLLWGRKFGAKEMSVSAFGERMREIC